MGEKSSNCSSTPQQQQQPTVTPSPPMNEQSPSTQQQQQQQQSNSRPTSSVLISGMRPAQSLAEWQLQAVLYRAKLTQYFDTFISQGGDDIDQIMQCDEEEFLEIMSLVGMASKPLHVRRLQRMLNEFSLNRAQFLIGAVPFIGLPPIDFATTSSSDNLTAALQFLVPGYLPTLMDQHQLSHSQPMSTSGTPSDIFFAAASSSMLKMPPSTQENTITNSGQLPTASSTSPSATAIALPLPDPSSFLLSLVNPSHFTTNVHQLQQHQSTSYQQHFQSHQHQPQENSDGSTKRIKLSSFSPPPTTPTTTTAAVVSSAGKGAESGKTVDETAGSFSTATSSSNDRLTDAEILRLRQLAQEMIEQLPVQLEPRQEAMSLPPDDPLRLEHFRLFARIYGRFDAKRKPNKALTRHERIVNEAAAQLSLLRPELLSRRDELFPLARKLARLFELPMTLRPSSEVKSGSPGVSSMMPSSVGNGSPTSNEECCDGLSTFATMKHEKGDEYPDRDEEDEESQESGER
uniref:Uncharacterized protein n=1 Tax=Globodera rostochiensis TaxID=31243 RepID=A0A914H3F1_GLORO